MNQRRRSIVFLSLVPPSPLEFSDFLQSRHDCGPLRFVRESILSAKRPCTKPPVFF
jgi:hypothetical protein